MTRWLALGAVALLGLPLEAAAQNIERGRLLYEKHCTGCHYERVHQRPRGTSEVQNITHLRQLVASRSTLTMTKYRFTAQDKEDVVQYLNASYYKFAK
jgi:mono/diheme cytochrome c family protein